mgnify:FL=1
MIKIDYHIPLVGGVHTLTSHYHKAGTSNFLFKAEPSGFRETAIMIEYE